MNDEPLDEYGCMDCIHDDEEDHTESCYNIFRQKAHGFNRRMNAACM